MKIKVKKNSLIYRLLTITIYRSNDLRKVSKSRFIYGMDANGFYLRVLGFINGFFKLRLVVTDAWQEDLLTKEEIESKLYYPENLGKKSKYWENPE